MKKLIVLLLFAFVLFSFAACGGDSPSVTETPSVTESPAATHTPTVPTRPPVTEAPAPTATPLPFTEGLVEGVLYFNEPEISGRAHASLSDLNVQRHHLTEEQFHEVFPYLDFLLTAWADYKADGTLVNFFARDLSSINAPAWQLDIRFWLDGFSSDSERFWFRHDFRPKVSNIYGVPVVAYMHDLLGVEIYGQAVKHFRTEFEMDGFVFLVTFNALIEDGQELMAEIVNGLVRNGTEVFTDLKF